MKRRKMFLWNGLVLAALLFSACQPAVVSTQSAKKTIVVTYSVLGSLVKELAGDQINVIVAMPNGQDPHEWEPSAKDIETLTKADLIVQNGLGLEGGMEKALAQAKEAGVKFFTASEAIKIRTVGKGEGIPSGDPDQAVGAEDPHLWTDPLTMIGVVDALSLRIKSDLGVDVSARAKELDTKLTELDKEVSNKVGALPEANRALVTGHESMGYFAQRYGFKLVGAIIPSLTTQAEVSAADMAALKTLVNENKVKAIFSELGTPKAVSDAIGKETGVKVVELTTHSLPEDGSYFTFMRNLSTTVIDNLQ
jgi:zinc/manganese transport system substrate-binding protein